VAINSAGRKGPDVRSDCWVQFERRESGGVEIELHSKVEALYGSSIRSLAVEVLNSVGIVHGRLEIEDSGALPFVIGARIETAVKRSILDSPTHLGSWLPPFKEHSKYESVRERLRRSRLYIPGNEPKFMLNAGLHKPDGIILDLEDSVASTEKDAARILVRNALRTLDFFGADRMVRINQGDLGLRDLDEILPHNVHVILIPKVETAEQVRVVDDRISTNQSKIYLMPIIESALGGINAYQIATSAPSVIALAIGLEDYTADIGVAKTAEGRESFWLRSQVVNAARAAGIQPIDTVFADVSDNEGLRASVLESKSLGFEGRGCIHPRQIPIVHEAFAPTPQELVKAEKIVAAFEEAQAKGLGVVSLGSKMIDPPVVKRALRTVALAKQMS